MQFVKNEVDAVVAHIDVSLKRAYTSAKGGSDASRELIVLDTPRLFFVSTQLVNHHKFDYLIESAIISAFHSYCPPGRMTDNWASIGTSPLGLFNTPRNACGMFSVVAICITCLQWVGTLPCRLQHLCMHIVQPVVVGLLVILIKGILWNWLIVIAVVVLILFETIPFIRNKRPNAVQHFGNTGHMDGTCIGEGHTSHAAGDIAYEQSSEQMTFQDAATAFALKWDPDSDEANHSDMTPPADYWEDVQDDELDDDLFSGLWGVDIAGPKDVRNSDDSLSEMSHPTCQSSKHMAFRDAATAFALKWDPDADEADHSDMTPPAEYWEDAQDDNHLFFGNGIGGDYKDNEMENQTDLPLPVAQTSAGKPALRLDGGVNISLMEELLLAGTHADTLNQQSRVNEQSPCLESIAKEYSCVSQGIIDNWEGECSDAQYHSKGDQPNAVGIPCQYSAPCAKTLDPSHPLVPVMSESSSFGEDDLDIPSIIDDPTESVSFDALMQILGDVDNYEGPPHEVAYDGYWDVDVDDNNMW